VPREKSQAMLYRKEKVYQFISNDDLKVKLFYFHNIDSPLTGSKLYLPAHGIAVAREVLVKNYMKLISEKN
jgi:hypothetical protein